MKGLILCAGLGTRLWPITLTLPKHLIPISNRPILFYLIDLFFKVGIVEIGIVVGSNEDIFKKVLTHYENEEVKFQYIRQDKPLGLANAVLVSKNFIKDERFLMVLGDNLYGFDIENSINEILAKTSNCQLLIKEVDNPNRYGIVDIDNKHIINVIEKPSNPPTNLAMAGIYVFDKNIFLACENIEPSWRGEYEITDSIKWLINNGFKVEYKEINCLWKDLGKPEDVLNANQYLLHYIDSKVCGTVDENTEINGNIKLGRNSRIINSIIRGPVTIGDDTIIENCNIGPYTSIYDKVELSKCAIENSIILDGCVISDIKSTIDSSIIERNSIIKGIKNQRRVNKFLLGRNSIVKFNN